MGSTNLARLAIKSTVIVAMSSACLSAAFAAGPTTPPGITLVEVVRELPISQPQILWVRPGDADGRTLLTYENDGPGTSKCVAECAREFLPLLAARGSKAFGDWTLIRRPEGQQWAYQGHPLYTWSKEKIPGEVATNVGLTETANAKLAESPVKAGSLMPPEKWQVARFTPGIAKDLPDGIEERLVTALQAVSLTDVGGHTLYTFDGDAKHDNQICNAQGCGTSWRPVEASALAAGAGEFTVVKRADGSGQWAWRKKPLYAFAGDELAGDAHGVGINPQWAPAIVTANFRPAQVSTAMLEGYGDTLTINGMTLYGGYAFEKRWGGRNLRDTFTNAYYKGKALGAAACADEQCLKTWQPFLAPRDAEPNGFWEPIKRDDGTLQWAYKGFALYTFAGDKAPGDHNGQATYDFAKVEGSGFDFKRISYLQEISKASGGVGIYWNIAKP